MSTARPSRIGFDATAALTQGGGIGRYTRELLAALVETDSPHHYRIFSARAPQPLPVRNPIPQGPNLSFRQTLLSPRWLYRLWYRIRLPIPVQLFTGKIDLFHSPDFVLPPVLGDVPTILTVHDLSFSLYPNTFTPALVSYLNRVVPWSVKRASHVLADSESTRNDLIRLYKTRAEKVTVLYSGVHDCFKPVTDEVLLARMRHKYSLGDEPYIFTVSTLQPRKNHQMLIRAFRPVANNTSYNLIIAGGKGWLYEEMMSEVERLDLTGRVRFIGFVDDDDLPVLYSEASIFVFPSLYEGFGLPLLEAMGCGTPVIASNASSLPEVAGDAALLLEPTNETAWTSSMLRLTDDVGLRVRLVAAGFRRVRRFQWKDSARQLLEVYQQLLG